jgi:hypothetical protein
VGQGVDSQVTNPCPDRHSQVVERSGESGDAPRELGIGEPADTIDDRNRSARHCGGSSERPGEVARNHFLSNRLSKPHES